MKSEIFIIYCLWAIGLLFVAFDVGSRHKAPPPLWRMDVTYFNNTQIVVQPFPFYTRLECARAMELWTERIKRQKENPAAQVSCEFLGEPQ